MSREVYEFTENHEHPEGGDRGGYAPETHSFTIMEDGAIVHDYAIECGDGGPRCFGFDNSTLDRLTTKEDALHFVREEIRQCKQKLVEAEECEKILLAATVYRDEAEYFGYDDEEEGDDEG